MQRKVVVFLLPLFFLNVAASDYPQKVQTINEVLEKVEKINKVLPQVGNSPADCTLCMVTAAGTDSNPAGEVLTDDVKLMKSCVESLCPDSTFSLAKVFDEAYSQANLEDSPFAKEFAPIITEIDKEFTRQQIENSRIMADWLKTGPALKKKSQIMAYNLLESMNDLSKFKFKAMDGSGGDRVVDEEGSRNDFSFLSSDEYKLRVNRANQFLVRMQRWDLNPEKIISGSSPQVKSKLNQIISEIKANANKIAQDPEFKFMKGISIFKELTSIEKNSSLSQFDEMDLPSVSELINNLMSNKIITNIFVSLRSDPDFQKILLSEPINLQSVGKKLGMGSYLEKQMDINSYSSDDRNSKIYCGIALALAQKVYPTKEQIREFKAKAKGIKDRFLKKATGLLSRHSSKIISNDAKKWSIRFPISREEYVFNLKQSLIKELENLKRNKVYSKEPKNSENRNIIFASKMLESKLDQAENLPPPIQICRDALPSPLPDAANAKFSDGVFGMGPLTIKFGEMAEGIPFHELSHLMSKNLHRKNISKETRNWYLKSRQCLIENHTELSNSEREQALLEVKKTGSSSYAEEDWADLVSSVIVSHDSNFACLFNRQMNDTGYQESSIKNADGSDSHSSGLYRLLHLVFLKNGKLPPICQQAIAAKGETVSFKNCLSSSR